MGWALTTVYVNRRRTLVKLEAGKSLLDSDLPAGVHTHDGLRWSDAEVERFAAAADRSGRRVGRKRSPHPATPPTPERQQRETNGQ
jgi:hypothetical protein